MNTQIRPRLSLSCLVVLLSACGDDGTGGTDAASTGINPTLNPSTTDNSPSTTQNPSTPTTSDSGATVCRRSTGR